MTKLNIKVYNSSKRLVYDEDFEGDLEDFNNWKSEHQLNDSDRLVLTQL